MKTITLRQGKDISTREVIAQVAKHGGERGMNVGEMRQRMRILDALDGAEGDELTLEDADYSTLARILKVFPFAVAHRELLQIVDDIEGAS